MIDKPTGATSHDVVRHVRRALGTRAVGMGIFFTVHYFCSTVGPMIAGWIADLTGDIASTYQFAGALLIASVLVLPIYHRLAARAPAE